MKRSWASLLALFLVVGPVRAGPILDFNLAPAATNGTVSYAGGLNPLVGNGLLVQTVTGLDSDANDDVTLTLSNGSLNFQTGSFRESVGSTWLFNSGGQITIVGGIPSLGIADGTTLVTGSFINDPFVTDLGAANYKVHGSSFISTTNAKVAQFFGFGPDLTWEGGMTLIFQAPGVPPNAFASTGFQSGNVNITATAVPEPSSLSLCLGGAMGVGIVYGVRRRRRLHALGGLVAS